MIYQTANGKKKNLLFDCRRLFPERAAGNVNRK
jgi:hypothetical protein